MFLKLLFCVDTYYMPCEYYHILRTLFIKIWVSTLITQYIPGYVILYYIIAKIFRLRSSHHLGDKIHEISLGMSRSEPKYSWR